MREKWQEIYTDVQLKRLQQILVDNLKVFIDVCNKLNIEYIVYGGTLLGTIKYNGLVPWDDDIDVAMPRKDYEKFLREAPSILPEDYFLQTPESEKKSPYLYAKLRKKGTIYIEEFHNKLDIEKGVYIDIYPIDNIPDDDFLRKKQFKKVQRWIYRYYFRQCLHVKFPIPKGKRKNYLYQISLYYLLHLVPRNYIIYNVKREMTKYNDINTKRKSCLFSPNYENIYVKFYPLQKKLFEGINVNVPNCYKQHLLSRYGDYTKDLPLDKRVGHIPFEMDF